MYYKAASYHYEIIGKADLDFYCTKKGSCVSVIKAILYIEDLARVIISYEIY